MIRLGYYNQVTVQRLVTFGAYVGDDQQNCILLPRKYLPPDAQPGSPLRVFAYLDGDNRPIATTQCPKATVGEFAGMRLIDITPAGGFLDWGLDKDLFLPYRNQLQHMHKGRTYIVAVYWDERSERIVGSCKLTKFLQPAPPTLIPGTKVDLLIGERTPLGTNVIVNNAYDGLLYRSDTFAVIRPGDRCEGYVRCHREDHKLDITLQQCGYEGALAGSDDLLQQLRQAGGFLPYTAQSDADQISRAFKMSKKTFKRIIGDLYKQRLIRFTDKGMHLVETTSTDT